MSGGHHCHHITSLSILQVYTKNCGYQCSTLKLVNGRYTGTYIAKSKADLCCYYHDLDLKVGGISATDAEACPIHEKLMSCMRSKGTAWGVAMSTKLHECMECDASDDYDYE